MKPFAMSSLWRWCFVLAAIALAGQLLFGMRGGFGLALAAAGVGAILCRLQTGRWPGVFLTLWWARAVRGLRNALATLRGRWLAAADNAPSYWEQAPLDATHAGYRADYERLVGKAELTRADFFHLAELADGLQGYGDRPLAKPPRARAFASFEGGGLMGGVAGNWLLAAGGGVLLALIAALGVQSARLDHAKNDLGDARRDLETAQRQREDWKARSAALAGAVADARALSTATAADLEAERARQARAAAVERRRQREIQDVLAGGGDAPAWRLRDDEGVS